MGFGGQCLYHFELLNYVVSTYDGVDKGRQINSIFTSHSLHFACSASTCFSGCPACGGLALIEIQMAGNGKGWGWGWAPPMWFPKGFGKGGWGRRRGPRTLGRP